MKIRIGNDFVFNWAIERGGLPEDLSSVLEKHLHLSVFGKRVELIEGVDYDITGNVIRIEVTPTIANIIGTYKAEFHYILPDNGLIDEDRKCAVDVDAFQIVAKTAQADDSTEFSMTSDMAIAFKGDKGDSAYQVWLDAGNIGTEEDYFNWLQKPATDAVSLIEDKIDELDTAIQQEEQRELAEGVRLSNEQSRVDAEALRVSGEVARNTAEGIRVSNESTRIENEGIRLLAEEDRVEAENIRVENEALRIRAELLREGAESDREDAEQLRQTNTSTAIQNANEATQNANSAAELANTKAEEANTAAQNADDARLAIEGDLALKADHGYSSNPKTLKQVDDSLAQLAGEVSLLDAVQGAKIKDIENVLSSANLGQSAQLSVSGVSPLSLPKNAANGGMQVKLEGLTEDVGGVITNFEPTGRIRSVGKNLFNAKWRVGKTYIGGVLTDSSTNSVTELCKVSGATYYRFDWKDALVNAIYQFDEERRYIPLDTAITASGRIVTTDANCRYISLRLATITPSTQEVRLTKSLTVAPYEPYKETNLYLTAPKLRSNGTVKDEIRKGVNGYELVKRISDIDGTVLATPVISPISHGGVLNSAENGTVYHEPIIADAGVYGTNMPILLTDYPISSIEEIIKHEDGVDTYLDVTTAVIAPDGLSFTHPDLTDGDLVLFTYAYDKESTNGNITATFYDSNVVKIDTVTGKAYKVEDVVTNGVLTRTLTEV